jgi:Golgi apparatus protein 1
VDLIHDDNLQELLQHVCNKDQDNLKCESKGKTGVLLQCMIDKRESIDSVACRTFIQRMEWVAFSDFRIITHFTNSCQKDIERFGCGNQQGLKVCVCNMILRLVFVYVTNFKQ